MTDPAFTDDMLEQFLSRYPDTLYCDVMIADINGVLRGKRINTASLAKVAHGQFVMPMSLFATQITGDCVEQTGLSLDTGDTDYPCLPIDNTLCPSPWQRKAMAQLLVAMQDESGTPLPYDPRTVLQGLQQRLAAMGFEAMVALELEFYLCDRERDPMGRPQPPLSPVTGIRENNTQVYGLIELDDYQSLMDDIATAASMQGIPATATVAEYAPGQFEVNLKHVPDPVLACDHALLLKRLIKGVASAHGYEASFMAKPYRQLAGSGLHVHISLFDDKGQNVFAGDPASATMKHAIGGLLQNMNDSMLLYAPHGNSFHRFESDGYVPMAPAWGYNNRTVALRIPASRPGDTRIEHRLGGADANPYLATAAILAGIIDGIENQLEAPRAIEGNAHKQVTASLHTNWHQAIEQFDASAFCQNYLGADFCKVYSTVKHAEHKLYNSMIPDFEYDWYFRTS